MLIRGSSTLNLWDIKSWLMVDFKLGASPPEVIYWEDCIKVGVTFSVRPYIDSKHLGDSGVKE